MEREFTGAKMRLTKSQVAAISGLLRNVKNVKASEAHSVEIQQRSVAGKVTCAVRVSFVGAGDLPPVDVAITGSTRLARVAVS